MHTVGVNMCRSVHTLTKRRNTRTERDTQTAVRQRQPGRVREDQT